MNKPVYITAIGAYLPNATVSNEEMEDYLGRIGGQESRVRQRILKQNGIMGRHYALTKEQESTHTNAEMAAMAIKEAMERGGVSPEEVQLIATGTTQADLPVPGFASMVHAELPIPRCEVASFQSVCASGMMALKHAFAQVSSGEKHTAVTTGSEFASRLFKGSRYEAQGLTSVPFDTEFLRWMLSDGAGAFLVQDRPATKGLSLRVDWIDLASHAHAYPACMYTGMTDNGNGNRPTWLDYPDYESASQAGALNLKQDIRLLEKVVQQGVGHYFGLIDKGMIKPEEVDWLCCHYSSEFFKKPIQDLMEKGGASIPEGKWFTNLHTKGNTGAASIYIMLEELLYSGKLQEGDTVLCMVPESGRFITSFMQLTVTGAAGGQVYTPRLVEAPELVLERSDISEKLVRGLTQVWVDFETNLLQVPVVRKMHGGTMGMEDYKLLLHDLRQQVIDGSQWISRAASHIDIELFDLRSAFIRHTATEHKDYQLLEKNYAALGEDAADIRTGRKNIGSEALSAYMFQRASRPNPVDLLGAMFIIEGIGKRLAGHWGRMIQEQLNLAEEQVSFFTYHGVADENHFHHLEQAINTLWAHPQVDEEKAARLADDIIKTARTVARLYRMQLEELGNY